jgi:hypothetical protein
LRSPFIAACCAFAIVLSIGAEAQDNPVPDGLKDKALVVSLHAVVLAGADSAAWQSDSRRVTMPGMPVGVKLVNANVVVIIQLTPYDDGKGGLVLVTQGQVWVRTSSGELSYRTTMDTVPVGYGERLLLPLWPVAEWRGAHEGRGCGQPLSWGPALGHR